ncbi:hypothetical protein [Rufibacter latericius]|uniref:Uncharacterized protein n=1 Tax=Rufibacter latericius TaxID=2487040 RepID=A0A3M9MDW0_9BACT|nr:hypothetical protein [Rufibacter latericius]RNI23023.1 hypothetical protein EFB08_19720 [Rufibacter latericius]
MKRFKEMLSGQESEASILANQWCGQRIKDIPEVEQLQWTRDRFETEDLLNLNHLNLLRYWATHRKDFTYDTFIDKVTTWCMIFYEVNRDKPTEAEQRFFDKMNDKGNLAPDDNGEPNFIASGFVLSKLL